MTADLFPGFETRSIDVPGARLHARVGGPAAGPAVALLHGFPETHASWHRIAPGLAANHRVVCLDLKGYGRSSAPAGDGGRRAYTKRTMAQEVAAAMEQLGHRSFSVAGHDRGALVAYRLALDAPRRVRRLAILDNLPTFVVWQMMEADPAMTPHWRTMAQPAPLAEAMLNRPFMETMLRSHTADGTLDCFDPDALDQFRLNWSDQARLHAFCEDYRAGAQADPEADRADLAAGRRITCPTLILWGEAFLGRMSDGPLAVWRRTFAPEAAGVEVPRGHFNAQESPLETLEALRDFLASDDGAPMP